MEPRSTVLTLCKSLNKWSGQPGTLTHASAPRTLEAEKGGWKLGGQIGFCEFKASLGSITKSKAKQQAGVEITNSFRKHQSSSETRTNQTNSSGASNV